MNSCKLRHTVYIQNLQDSQDSFGQPVPSWPPYKTVRAYVEPLNGRELFAAQQVNAETTTRITIRYTPGINATMRIVHESIIYNIHSIIDPEMRHVWLIMMCGSGVNLG